MSLRPGLAPPTRSLPGLLVCVLLWAVAWPAAAEPTPETERWVPAISVLSGARFQKANGTTASTLRGFVSDDVLAVSPFMEGGLELMSPALQIGPVQPRLFVRGGVGRSWDALRRSPKEGSAGSLEVPDFSTNSVPLETVRGRGSETRLQANPFFYTAAAGIALSMPFDGDRALRLKSSVEYRYGATEIEAVISEAQSINADDLCPCRLGVLTATDQKDQHALGVGLELEVDATRLGPFLMAVNVGGQAHRILAGRNLRVAATGTFDDGITPLDVASETELERWNFRFVVGLRFRWLPE